MFQDNHTYQRADVCSFLLGLLPELGKVLFRKKGTDSLGVGLLAWGQSSHLPPLIIGTLYVHLTVMSSSFQEIFCTSSGHPANDVVFCVG